MESIKESIQNEEPNSQKSYAVKSRNVRDPKALNTE